MLSLCRQTDRQTTVKQYVPDLSMRGHKNGIYASIEIRSTTVLTHDDTMPHFDTLKIYSCGKHCEKKRDCFLQAISHFLTMFPTLFGTYFSY